MSRISRLKINPHALVEHKQTDRCYVFSVSVKSAHRWFALPGRRLVQSVTELLFYLDLLNKFDRFNWSSFSFRWLDQLANRRRRDRIWTTMRLSPVAQIRRRGRLQQQQQQQISSYRTAIDRTLSVKLKKFACSISCVTRISPSNFIQHRCKSSRVLMVQVGSIRLHRIRVDEVFLVQANRRSPMLFVSFWVLRPEPPAEQRTRNHLFAKAKRESNALRNQHIVFLWLVPLN